MMQKAMYQEFKLVEKRQENYRTQTLIFDHPLASTYPGQFIMIWLPEIGEKPFSIANCDPLAVTVSEVGAFSKALCRLSRNNSIWVRGPLGRGFDLQGNRHLIVGGGYGAAPLHFLASQAVEQGDAVIVCLGAKTKNELMLIDVFNSLGCQVSIATDDGSVGQMGSVTDLLGSIQNTFHASTLYACGPTSMLSASAKWCRQIGLSAQLSWDAYIRCGIGLCGSCELDEETQKSAGLPKGWLVCRDGPVSFLFPHPKYPHFM